MGNHKVINHYIYTFPLKSNKITNLKNQNLNCISSIPNPSVMVMGYRLAGKRKGGTDLLSAATHPPGVNWQQN